MAESYFGGIVEMNEINDTPIRTQIDGVSQSFKISEDSVTYLSTQVILPNYQKYMDDLSKYTDKNLVILTFFSSINTKFNNPIISNNWKNCCINYNK